VSRGGKELREGVEGSEGEEGNRVMQNRFFFAAFLPFYPFA
jgi:hypothetical protein